MPVGATRLWVITLLRIVTVAPPLKSAFGGISMPPPAGSITSVAMPGTHMYQRRSFFQVASRSASRPPRNVPAVPSNAKNASQSPASVGVIVWARRKNEPLS